MNWLRWLFCPHDWKDVIYESEIHSPKGQNIGYEYVYQCSKCTRFKKVKV